METISDYSEEHLIPKKKTRRRNRRKYKKHSITDPAHNNNEGDDLSITNPLNDLPAISETLLSSPIRASISLYKKKLLILDLNGLLTDIVSDPPKGCRPDIKIARRAIFKRPFYLDFLKFCFERFEVGIWSSRSRKNVDRVVDYLLGDMKHKLLFCWDMSQCTATQFFTLENRHKALVFKELRRVWEKCDPTLPWEKGYYNESNTLLVDDSPYKALLNPAHTAIFPHPFQFQNVDDNSLGAGGDLKVYLEQLAEPDNVQIYVERHPFGQRAVTESSTSWDFYLQVMSSVYPHPTI